MSDALRNLVKNMERSPSPVSPREFKGVMDRMLPFFSDHQAHDAFELLVQLLDLIHTDVSEVSELFYGKIVARRKFKCKTMEEGDDQPAFWMLPLPRTRGSLTLENCIAEWKKPDPFDDENPLYCPKHRRAEAYQMNMEVQKFARYIIIQLNRFNRSGRRSSKDTRRVTYPSKLDSEKHAREPTGIYRLVGVVCHHGSEYGGHYTCCVGDPDDPTWYEISDSAVRQCKEAPVMDDAYVLFYEREKRP
jgi:ubiquitin C-terminal hydrolase